MRKAFTIIEILISVVIVSTVLIALLKVSANATQYMENLFKDKDAKALSSIIGLGSDPLYNRSDKSLEDFLGKYIIENDELRHFIKEEKIAYTEEQVSKIMIGEEEGEEKIDESFLDASSEEDEAVNPLLIQLEFVKVSAKQKSRRFDLYTIRILN